LSLVPADSVDMVQRPTLRGPHVIQNRARGDEICLSKEVHDAPDVEQLLTPYLAAREQIFLKGIDREVTIFRMGIATCANDDQMERSYVEN